MKKLLLLAAVAMAFGASAQTLTQDWKHSVSFTSTETRQGVGMNGKIYVHDKSTQQVYVVSETGVENTILPGSTNTAINRDGAGNLVISTALWAANWAAGSGFMVYNPATPDQITNLSFDDESLIPGKSFNIGIAAGDLTSNGELLVAGDASGSNLSRFVVVDGEISPDDSYPAIVNNGPAPQTTTVINAFMDGETQKYLYVTRNSNPVILVANGDDFDAEKTLVLPNKGATNGAELFILGSDKYVVYPTLPNYLGGFAIAKLGDEENTLVVEVEAPFATNPNGIQMDWLNAEVVDQYTANIYQYIPGAYCAKYTFSLPHEGTGISDVTAKKAEVKKVIENGQIYIINGDAKYNVMGAQVK
ncbi:MAG: hypothetical protein ACI30R_01195 [Sodaliphilus sp.]